MEQSRKDKEESVLHVAVAVIVKNHSVLIAKRPPHVHQGDLWEFPGGKVETGETVKQALYREIKEELGIEIVHSEPMISVLYHYEDKSVLLDTWKVSRFKGRGYGFGSCSTGLESQKVQWVGVDKLNEYSFPAANKAIVSAIQLPDTYVITPDAHNRDQFLNELKKSLNSVSFLPLKSQQELQQKPQQKLQTKLQAQLQEQLLEKPQALVQLRIFSLQGNALEHLITQACELVHDVNARVILNAGMLIRSELTTVSRTKLLNLADGLHLPGSHLAGQLLSENRRSEIAAIQQYRQEFPHKLLSASCHNQHEIDLANRHQVDFIVLSPVQMTHSHPHTVPLGWEKFTQLVESSQAPVYALGGLKLQDIARAKISGAQGIAAISAFWKK
jgi:8-oxo-dGTP diphosphatase